MSKARQNLEQRARRAIVEYAIFRWQSAIVVALTLVAAFAVPGLWWLVLATGVLVEALVIGWSLSSEKQRSQAVANMLSDEFKVLRGEFNPARLKDKSLQRRVERALEYWHQINDVVVSSREGVLQDRVARTTKEMSDWLQAIYRLSQRLDTYRQDEIIKRDLSSVRPAIDQLRKNLAEEDNPIVRAQLEKTIADRERQWQHLDKLQNMMEKADYQVESTLSALGTVYSQLLLVGTQNEQGGRAQRLQEEIHEQVAQLEDLVEAMDEVYLERR